MPCAVAKKENIRPTARGAFLQNGARMPDELEQIGAIRRWLEEQGYEVLECSGQAVEGSQFWLIQVGQKGGRSIVARAATQAAAWKAIRHMVLHFLENDPANPFH